MSRIISLARDPILFLAKTLLALDLVLWLFWLPVMLRIHTIPILLRRLARSEKHIGKMPMGLRDVVGIVTHVCSLRPFPFAILPKAVPSPIAHAIPDIEPNGISSGDPLRRDQGWGKFIRS